MNLTEMERTPVSVQMQVDMLIREATSGENFAQLYIGWMPFIVMLTLPKTICNFLSGPLLFIVIFYICSNLC